MPENAVRFKFTGAGTTNGVDSIYPFGTIVTVPDRHKGVIHWIYLKANVLFRWKLFVNGIPDLEYGTVYYASMDPAVDGWLMPLGNSRIVLNPQDKVTLTLDLPLGVAAGNSYVFLVRGYYWPEEV